MKKINIKVIGLTIMVLSLLMTSGVAINNTIAPGGFAGEDPCPDPGGG